MSGKRTGYLALLIGVFVIILIKLLQKSRQVYSIILPIIVFLLIFVFIYSINSGMLESLLDYLGINSMGRMEVYSYFNDSYTLSPLYFGKGFQYIHMYMVEGLGTPLVNDFQYLHNSFLQLYIEIGFWGFSAWFIFYLFYYKSFLTRRGGRRIEEFYIVILMSMFSVFAFDNILTYPFYQVTFCTLLFVFLDIVKINMANPPLDEYHKVENWSNLKLI